VLVIATESKKPGLTQFVMIKDIPEANKVLFDNKELADKIFEDQGLQLSKGDIIYMFSDGYPDQFGGSIGKKFKMVRLKNLLTDIYQKTMDEQYNYVKSTFNLWKENYPQVDDVLFMGIRL